AGDGGFARRAHAGPRLFSHALLPAGRHQLGRRVAALPLPVHHRRRPDQLAAARRPASQRPQHQLARDTLDGHARAQHPRHLEGGRLVDGDLPRRPPGRAARAAGSRCGRRRQALAALPRRLAARDPACRRLRDRDARDRRLQRLHLRLSDDGRRPARRDAGAAHLHVPAGVRVPRLRLRLGAGLHADPDRVRALTRTAAALPPPEGDRLMVVGSVRRARAILGTRLLLLTGGAVVMALPFVYMLSTSFKPNSLVLKLPPQFVPHPATTSNYTGAWSSNQFGHYFLNSVLVAAATTAAAVLLSAMMAYAFARFRFPGRTLFFGVLLLGLMVPTMMMLIPHYLLAKQHMLLDSLWGLIV